MNNENQARSRIEKIIFKCIKVADEETQQRISEASESGVAEKNFTIRENMAFALLVVFHERPAFFLLGVLCLFFIWPTLLILNSLG